MLTCPCSVHPRTSYVHIVKLGFTGVYIIFLFLLYNIDCYCGSNVPTIYILSIFFLNITLYHLKIIIFTAVKNCSISYRRVNVMLSYTNESQEDKRVRLESRKNCAHFTFCNNHNHSIHEMIKGMYHFLNLLFVFIFVFMRSAKIC